MKTTILKVLLFVIFVAFVEVLLGFVSGIVDPQIKTTLTTQTVNGDATHYVAQQGFKFLSGSYRLFVLPIYLIAAFILVSSIQKQYHETHK